MPNMYKQFCKRILQTYAVLNLRTISILYNGVATLYSIINYRKLQTNSRSPKSSLSDLSLRNQIKIKILRRPQGRGVINIVLFVGFFKYSVADSGWWRVSGLRHLTLACTRPRRLTACYRLSQRGLYSVTTTSYKLLKVLFQLYCRRDH